MATKDQLKELEDQAIEVLRSRQGKSAEDIPPVIVEFSGSPKAGKSTTIDIVNHFFRRVEHENATHEGVKYKYKVWAPTEGASKRTPSHLKSDLVAFNLWSLNYAISEILLAYHNVDRHDLVILDRGPFDSLAWMKVLRKENEITHEEYKTIENYIMLGKWAGLMKKIFIFTCSPEVSLKRENKEKLIDRPGIAMNEGRLSSLLEQYENLKNELTQKSFPVRKIDTTNDTTPQSTAYEIASEILEELRQG